MEDIKRKMLKDLRTGVYSLVALNLVAREGPLHGYGLMVRMKEVSDGIISPSESTVYETLKYLEKKKLIDSFWAIPEGGRVPRKYYVITELGKKLLDELNKEVKGIMTVLMKVMEGESG